MTKINCWEFKKCGREPGGSHESDLGVCPAVSDKRLNGVHQGYNGGRACWIMAGTFCGGKIQGSFVSKAAGCLDCDFYRRVELEEGDGFLSVKNLLLKLR